MTDRRTSRPAAEVPPTGSQEGQVLGGRYRLGKLLGTGSFGRVYEGHHTSLTQRVAIKVFRTDVVVLAGGPERVLADMKAASRIHHRNIVDVHDIGRFEDTVYVATELVLGGTLHALLVRVGRLPWPHAREVALQLAAALKAAHKRDVLHRGLRAANCFVLEDLTAAATELRIRIKVSDFAFAHPGLAGGGRGEEHTSPFVGDAAYTAPELAQGVAASVHSDIYAFGVLLYRMLTGSLPFEGSTPYQVLEAHVTRPVSPPRDIVRSIPAEVEAIVLRALAKDPSERFESMRELELAIEEVSAQAQGEPEEAAPSRTLDELDTGQHVQVGPQVPAVPVRDDAMHAAFERREEPGEPATSMFDRRMMAPYFGPTDAPEAPPEPTIMLGASMFAQFAPQRSAFPQLMSGAPEPTVLLGTGHPFMPAVAPPEATTLLSPSARPVASPEATTLFSHPSADHAGRALLPPTMRLEGMGGGANAFVDGPTMSLPAWGGPAATVQRPAPSPGHLARNPSPAPPVAVPIAAPVRFAPVIAPTAGAYAASTAPVPARVQAMHRPGAPMQPSPAIAHSSASMTISAVSITIVGMAVAVAGVLIGLALACPARAASSEPNIGHERRPSSQD